VRALRLHRGGELRLEDEPAPDPGPDEVLLRVDAVGLCGSDRHWVLEGGIGDATLTRPLVLGHEFVATVESGPRAGTRVAVDPADPCRTCGPCLDGLGHLCLEPRFAGHGLTDGALCELLAWPERLTHRLPPTIATAEGVLLEPLGVALHALDLGHIRADSSAAVFGCGPLGLLLIRALCSLGVEVIASDPLPHRLACAKASGAGVELHEVDVAFEVAGSPAAIEEAVAVTRPGGRIVLVGIPADDRTTFPAAAARRKGLTLLVSRRMKGDDLPRAIGLVESGRIPLEGLVTQRYGLERWREAFDALLERRGIKIVVEPGTG
jgi:L-iditol 2-dehydrogenase